MQVTRSRISLGIALFGTAAWLSVFCPAATPAADARPALRTVTVTISGSGTARWSVASDADKGSLAMNYSWRGKLKFGIRPEVLKDPAHTKFSTRGATTLRATWVGDFVGRKLAEPYLGAYHCVYKGTNVPGKVSAQLTNGKVPGVIWLVLHPQTEQGFFPAKTNGATVSCSTGYGDNGPTHFEPGWLFRDNILDHGQFSSTTAVIVVPSKLLPRGSVAIKFPYEVGKRTSPFAGNLHWNNVGRLSVRAS
jgi:hypothetical protein